MGRRLSAAAVELALASYPGFHVTAPPGKGTPYGVFETAFVAQDAVEHLAVLPDGQRERIAAPTRTVELRPVPEPPPAPRQTPAPRPATAPRATRRAPLGLVAGARSGDKGSDANIGVWARHGGPGSRGTAPRGDGAGRGVDGGQDRTDAIWHWLRPPSPSTGCAHCSRRARA